MTAAFDSMFAVCYSTFGEAATYDGGSVTVVLDHNMSQWGDQVSVAVGRVALSVRKSEVPERPARGEAFTVDAKVYRVESTIRETSHEWALLVKEDGA